MADLTIVEKRAFERLVNISTGYVLDFSDRTFREFVADIAGLDISGQTYSYASCSKANRLRGFWAQQSNPVVGKLLAKLLEHAGLNRPETESARDLEICRLAVTRLRQGAAVAEIDALNAPTDDRDFEVVARAARASIEQNEPAAGLDRLHTFVVTYLRALCSRRGISTDRDKPLHSLMGEYVKAFVASEFCAWGLDWLRNPTMR